MAAPAARTRIAPVLREVGAVVLFAAALAVVTNLPLLDDFGRSIPGQPRRPARARLGGPVGWPRAPPPAARPLPGERLLAAREHARVHRRLAGRLLAGRRRRARARLPRSSTTTRSSCSPTRSRSSVRTRSPASSARRRSAPLSRVSAFAYAPWRHAHEIHLNVLSTGGVPLALFLLLRGYRRSDWQPAARRVARRGVAAEPRLQHRPSLRLPAVRA